MPLAGRGPRKEDVVARGALADADAEGAAILRSVRVDDEAAGCFVEVVGELHRQAVVVGVAVPLEPELDRDRGLAGEVERGRDGVVDAVEAHRRIGVAFEAAGHAEGRPAGGGRRARALAVGKGRTAGLSHAPVVEQGGGAEHRLRVGGRPFAAGAARFFFAATASFFFAAFTGAAFRAAFAAAGGDDGVVVVGDRGRAEGAPVDRDLVEVACAEEAVGRARHEVEGRVGEVATAGAAVELFVGDRFAVDVGDDLLGGRRRGVEHEGVVVPFAGAGPFEVDVVAGVAAADADAEGCRRTAARWGRPGSRRRFVEVVGELHRQAVVVGVVVPLEPEFDRHRVGAGEVDRGFGGVVDAVEFRRPVGVVRRRRRGRPGSSSPKAVAGLEPALSAKVVPEVSPMRQ